MKKQTFDSEKARLSWMKNNCSTTSQPLDYPVLITSKNDELLVNERGISITRFQGKNEPQMLGYFRLKKDLVGILQLLTNKLSHKQMISLETISLPDMERVSSQIIGFVGSKKMTKGHEIDCQVIIHKSGKISSCWVLKNHHPTTGSIQVSADTSHYQITLGGKIKTIR
ncbi:hypothetical protein [uncultured Microscilla sp.]|uniref:hypothetical protein n=1 Tax=uncultured Microscilla sp. TaxID=432653 RepID=UPI00260EE349|nr:hypothetical protein [uncultured Microscilla sp.]